MSEPPESSGWNPAGVSGPPPAREFRAASGLNGDRMHQVAELTHDRGLVTVIGELERWLSWSIRSGIEEEEGGCCTTSALSA